MDGSINMTTAGLVVTACCITLLIWELISFVKNKRRALLSTWFQRFGFRQPFAMLCLGGLFGHFWMYYPPTWDGEVFTCPHCDQVLTLTLNEKTGDYFAEKAEQ